MTEQPFLTIGMPTYDDFDGVFFSIQSLRLHHAEVMDRVELLVVDNNPSSPHGDAVRRLMSKGNVPNGKYITETNWRGPWVKDLVFRNASAPWVMCMDGHVLLPPGELARLINFFKRIGRNWITDGHRPPGPGKYDLFQGPLMYDNLKSLSTHFEPVWRGEMWGIWATDNRGKEISAEPFEIPMQGMGLFTCHKTAWETLGGFNRMFRGFGGEEGYIHEKFRQAGRKCWCLPFMRWLHRFDRPAGVKYQLTWQDKVRNYFIGHIELGLDVEPIIEHFTRAKKIPRTTFEQLYKEVLKEVKLSTPSEASFTLRNKVVRDAYVLAMNKFGCKPNRLKLSKSKRPLVEGLVTGDVVLGCQLQEQEDGEVFEFHFVAPEHAKN